jgi:hypothetical protein
MSNATSAITIKPIGRAPREIELPVDGGSKIYGGTLVAQLSTAMLVAGSTANSGAAIAVAVHDQDNTSGSDADKRLRVLTDGVFVFTNGTSTDACSEATALGAPVYMLDDHTVADNDNSAALKRAGYFMGMEPDGGVRVLVLPILASLGAPAADVGALAFTAVAGTANTTLEALPDPTDTPASADALRDDIVATLLPPLRNNFADIATQMNAFRTALENAGLML